MKIFFKILALPFILLVIYIISRMILCSADWDVTRNGETIEYAIGWKIIKQGYFSLSVLELEGLPYKLKNCKRDIKYSSSKYSNSVVPKDYPHIKRIDIEERCLLEVNDNRYNFWYNGRFDYNPKNPDKPNKGRASFGIEKGRSSSEWGIGYSKKSNKIEPTYGKSPESWCHCHTGFLCSSFKQ